MSTWLLIVVSLIYAAVAVDLIVRRDWLALTYAGYAVAGVGVIMKLGQ